MTLAFQCYSISVFPFSKPPFLTKVGGRQLFILDEKRSRRRPHQTFLTNEAIKNVRSHFIRILLGREVKSGAIIFLRENLLQLRWLCRVMLTRDTEGKKTLSRLQKDLHRKIKLNYSSLLTRNANLVSDNDIFSQSPADI